MEQTTVARSVEWRGIGLHSGRPAAVTVRPADPDTGLVFRVRAGEGSELVAIPARPDHVHSTTRATTLAARVRAGSGAAPARSPRPSRPGSNGGPPGGSDGAPLACVATVEHLLAALFAFGIHDALIDVEGGEVPALDGSASPFAARLRRAGSRRLAASRRTLEVDEPFEVVEGDRWIRIEPAESLVIDYSIEFAHPAIGRQRHVVSRLDRDVFESSLAPARTFGFAAEVDRLHALGLALGGDLTNTVVLDDTGRLNPEPLRFPDEFVRHKIVDLLGDLALLEGELNARITVERGGHGLHHALVRSLAERVSLGRTREVARPRARLRASGQPA